MSGGQQGVPEQPMAAAGVPQMPAMASGQFPWMAMQGGFDPAMMQQAASMMATFQQQQQQQQQQPGQFPQQAANPQMYYAAMQMPGMAPGMVMPAAQAPAVASTMPQVPAVASTMPAPDGAGRDLSRDFRHCVESLSAVESDYYAFLWGAAGCSDCQRLEGKPAFDFLSKSQLQRGILKRIWDLADWQKQRCLGWPEFVITMKLISAAQRNQLVSLERVLKNCSSTSMDCPEFEGIPNASAFRPAPAPQQSADPPAPGPAADPLGMDMTVSSAAPAGEPTSRLPEGSGEPSGLQSTGPGLGGAVPLAPASDGSTMLAGDTKPAAVSSGFGAFQELAVGDLGTGAGGSPDGDGIGGMQGFSLGTAGAAATTPAAMPAVGSPPAAAVPSAGSPPPDHATVESSDTKALGHGNAWADFAAPHDDRPHAASAAAPTDSWADFAPAQPAQPAPRKESADAAWADFESAPAPDAAAGGTAAPVPLDGPAAPGGASALGLPPPPAGQAGQGDLWSKMSAFDDLLREDDALGGSAAAAGLGEAFAAEASLQPPPPPPPAVPPPAAQGLGEGLADEEWGDFGDFAAGSPEPSTSAAAEGGVGVPAPTTTAGVAAGGSTGSTAAAGAALPSADDFDADFGDFSGGGGGGGESVGAFDAGGSMDGSGELAAAESAKAGSSGTKGGGSGLLGEADPWGDFAGADSAVQSEGAPPAPGPDALGASADLLGQPPAPAPPASTGGGQGDAFAAAFDGEEFAAGATASSGAGLLGSEPSPAHSPAGPQVEWDAFAAPSGQTGAADPEAGQSGEAAGAGWAAFGSDGFGGFEAAGAPPAASEAASPGAGMDASGAVPTAAPSSPAADPLAFDDDEAPGRDAPGKAAAAAPQLGLPPPKAGGSPLASSLSSVSGPAGAAERDASWAAFDTEGEAVPGRAAPHAVPAELGGGASKSVPRLPSPKAAAAPGPVVSQPVEADSDEDGEFFRIAESLASLGLFEEAEPCWAHAKVQKQLEKAEERKREAAAKEDFEGAIKTREEIKTLTAELAPQQASETWRRLSAQGQRDTGLEEATARLRQRCQYLDDAFARAALCAAVATFRSSWPSAGPAGSLGALRGLVRRRREAQQMARSIEAVTSTDVPSHLNVLLACLSSFAEVLQGCAEQLRGLALPEWSGQERALVLEDPEFRDFLRGLGGLRCTAWRLGLVAEIFLPCTAADPSGQGTLDGGDTPCAGSARLEEFQASLGSQLEAARAAWAGVRAAGQELGLQLEPWEPGGLFEAGSASAAARGHRSSPVCGLCLLPTLPLGFEAQADPDDGIASVLFKGGLWHAQCANFWVMHGATSAAFKNTGMADPFAQ